MPTTKEMEQFLFSAAPKELAMSWDNVGLLVGQTEQEVARVLVALDITEEVVEEAIASGASLIVAHHPVMNCKWHAVQNVRDDTPQGRVLTKLIQNRIGAICMHTNLDIAQGGVNDILARALQLENPQPLGEDGCGRHGMLRVEMPLEKYLALVYKTLHCSGMRYVSAGRPVHHVAVGGGACWDYYRDALEAGCDTFVTSDLGYHDFLDAKAAGLNVIDAGHYPTEDLVGPYIVSLLQAQYPTLPVVKSAVHREVFQYFTL